MVDFNVEDWTCYAVYLKIKELVQNAEEESKYDSIAVEDTGAFDTLCKFLDINFKG